MANYGQISNFKVSMEQSWKNEAIYYSRGFFLKITLANIGHIVLLFKGRKLL